MDTSAFRGLLCIALFLSASQILTAQEAPCLAHVQGGLVVQFPAAGSPSTAPFARTGRYLVHVLDSDPAAVAEAREAFRAEGIYGLASAETLATPPHLPFTENLVNVLVLGSPTLPLAEVLRVLVPGGELLVSPQAGLSPALLQTSGFASVSQAADGTILARKPWPEAMDAWSHPRHAANGNPVSDDTAVGIPKRVRWVAAATSEVEGLVTAGGRNFYGGVLARDSFNGLRLWHQDLAKGELNEPAFSLPPLSDKRARPVASNEYLFSVVQGKLTALLATTGEAVRQFPGSEQPREVIHSGVILISATETHVQAFKVETASPLWQHDAAEPRFLALDRDTVCFLHGRPKRGEPVEALALDLHSGNIRWKLSQLPWLNKVTRIVMHNGQVAMEVSSLTDHDAGNALYLLSAETGDPLWEKRFPPGMNHARQARAMFTPSGLWILHGGKENTQTKETTTRLPVQVSALDPKTGETLKTHAAGLAHCFPPVATVKYMFSGVFDLTDLRTGQSWENPITKANCSREAGWVPANGLIYTTPKHCTCWPMVRGFVALAPDSSSGDSGIKKPVDQIEFPLIQGPAAPDPRASDPAPADWPTYRSDRWRSGSSASDGPSAPKLKWKVRLHHPAALPRGPILFDWQENPYIKGPISAPTIANGRVFVAHPDAHEVISLDAATGKELWRFTAQGRVDTPPTIDRGLALFGCHAGFVYALRADNGQLVWRFQAAPHDERIVAYGQLESPWPVPGAVLVRNRTAYAVAGRQPLADGGVLLFALDPLTGEKKWVHRLDEIPHKPDPTGKDPYLGFYENSGLEFDPIDILHEEEDGIAMSRWLLSSDGTRVKVDKWNAFCKLDTGGGAVWVPRGSWNYGARHEARFRGEAPRRPLTVFRDGKVYGQLEGSTEIFCRDFDSEALAKFNGKWITGWAAAQEANKGGKPFRSHRVAEGARWTTDPYTPAEAKTKPFVPGTPLLTDLHAMALAHNQRFYSVHRDGRLKVLSTDSGVVIAECQVPAPMWDGLAVAQGKLFLSTLSGEVCCLDGELDPSSPAH